MQSIITPYEILIRLTLSENNTTKYKGSHIKYLITIKDNEDNVVSVKESDPEPITNTSIIRGVLGREVGVFITEIQELKNTISLLEKSLEEKSRELSEKSLEEKSRELSEKILSDIPTHP